MKLETHLSKTEYPDGVWLQSGDSFVLLNAMNIREMVQCFGWRKIKKIEHEESELSTIFI